MMCARCYRQRRNVTCSGDFPARLLYIQCSDLGDDAADHPRAAELQLLKHGHEEYARHNLPARDGSGGGDRAVNKAHTRIKPKTVLEEADNGSSMDKIVGYSRRNSQGKKMRIWRLTDPRFTNPTA